MTVKTLFFELGQFPKDLEVVVLKDDEVCRVKTIDIIINDGRPQCAIQLK